MSESPRTRYAQLSGLRHRVLVWPRRDPGRARPMLLLHGFLDQADSFGAMADALLAAGQGPLVALDFRGHGHSQWIGDGGYYHFPDYVRDVAELVACTPELGEPFVLLGHSMGGTVGTYAAATLRRSPRGLVLLEGTGPTGYQPEHAPVRMAQWLDDLGKLQRWRARRFSTVAQVVERLRVAFPELHETVLVDFAQRCTVEEPDGLRWRYDPLHRTRSPVPFSAAIYQSFASEVTGPVLSITGERSEFARRDGDRGRREAALRGSLERAVVAGAGHMMHLSHPVATAGIVAAWMDAH